MSETSTQSTAPPSIAATPAPGVWVIDPNHSEIGFTVRHLLSKVRGRFTEYTGTLTVADPPERSVVEGAVKTASISSSQAQRDDHLRTADFLDVANHPEITFKSTAINRTGDATAKLTGDLTIKGITKPVTWDVEFHGVALDPMGQTKAAFSATVIIDREDWGLSYNAALEAGGFLVGKEVTLTAETQFLLQKV